MQVSQINDHVTHAVIGGSKAINFGISDDAELMNVLSKALYTDQQLAVIRETMCNAWDAHIEAGISDTAFWVTLDNKELIVRDFGPGIPLDMIGPVYGTYGGSTKKMNGNVTGGFGLGCKSPFAYTEHFEVTSWNQGTMTVYNMSKSSAEVQGKPGIIPIVSVPTTETGLQVRIKLKSPHDRGRFEKLIRRIAENGEMNCVFNGVTLEKLPFDQMVHNFLVTNKQLIETPQTILLRYGHVIYPIEMAEPFSTQYARITQILGKIPKPSTLHHNGNRYKIVFQAPPNTISITPSREALSMQEGTINTITKLLDDFLTIAEDRLEVGCFDLLQKSIEQTWLNSAPNVLFETKDRIPNLRHQETVNDIMVTFDQFITRFASYSYPDYPAFKQKDQIGRVQALIDSGFGDSVLLQQFKERLELEFSKPEKDYEIIKEKDWFDNYILKPLTSALVLDSSLNINRLFLYCQQRKTSSDKDVKPIVPSNMAPRPFFKYFPWLRKIVVLAHNRLEFELRASNFPIMTHWMGKVEDVFLYVVPRSPKKVEAAREFFKKGNYVILDLTVAQPWEAQDAVAPAPKEYTSRAKRKGIPTLESCLIPDTQNINMTLPNMEEERLIDSPEFIIKASYKSDTPHLPYFTTTVSRFIIKNWGKIGGFVVNSNQEAKYTAMGAALYEDFILEKIFQEFSTNPRIIESLPFMFNRSNIIAERKYGRWTYEHELNFMGAVYSDPDLVDYFGLVQTMTEDDQLYWTMWTEFKSENLQGTKGIFKKITDLLESIEINQKVMDLFDLIRKSYLLLAFDSQQTKEYMAKKPGFRTVNPLSPKQRLILRDMLLQAIEG
jgi:hypothetical protein